MSVDLYVLEIAFTSAHSKQSNMVRLSLPGGFMFIILWLEPDASDVDQDSHLMLPELQFDDFMTSYKKHSKQWSAVYNKFAEG